ncbi:TlpA family protein disulfide reductase [Barnesiella propionica]|uniref:TlpA family protein disulfide reductase n=1 Tax=Barnesiella propionica TaxID=2981781 RepID=UPI0011CA1D7A|nr:TlpA disulfide reductase family protein [Barnesiella propionica]MCU6768179.1 TlpA family protein disulfide reductase [Barnesiella propionica]
MKKGIFILLIAGVFAACSGNKKSEKDIIESDSVQVISTANEESRGYIVQVGDTAPDFSMVLSTTGDTVKLSQLRGKLVMLQFTASWCGVCREEMPHIETEIWQKHKDNPNFALLGIDRDEPAETVLKFIKTTGVTYPIGLDPNADIFGLYADKDAGITRNVIIDKDGKIIMLTRLYDPQEFAQMTELINEILK